MAGGDRSHEFNPETSAPVSLSRSRLREYKGKAGKHSDLPDSAQKISYGKRFAKTEELYQARVMERQLVELAGGAGQKARKGKAKKGAASKVAATVPELNSRHQVLEQVTRGAPIGAMPPLTEPPAPGGFGEVWGDARRYFEMFKGGIRDAATAGMRLARLPVEVAVLLTGRMRPRHA